MWAAHTHAARRGFGASSPSVDADDIADVLILILGGVDGLAVVIFDLRMHTWMSPSEGSVTRTRHRPKPSSPAGAASSSCLGAER